MIYSFDIFDTTLTRSVARPKDIFRLMQRKLFSQKGKFPQLLIDDFYASRFKAERRARISKYWHRQGEITLKDIYEILSTKFHLNHSQCQELIDLELMTEYASICPITWTLSEIKSLRQNDQRIIFISDMYLPFDFIERLLLKVGAYQKGKDKIYLSGTVGLAKIDGSLFRHVLEQEQCLPGELCHYGDDVQSDIYVPLQMGINTYGTSPEQAQRILKSCYFEKIKKYFNYIFQC